MNRPPSANNRILAANLALLKRHRPALLPIVTPLLSQPLAGEIFFHANGQPNIRYRTEQGQTVLLHPDPHPEQAGEACIPLVADKTGQVIYVFGFGLGYEAETIVRHAQSNHIVFIEHDPTLFVHALKLRDLSAILTNPRVHLFPGIQLADFEAAVSAPDTWYFLHARPYLLQLRHLTALAPSFYAAAEKVLLRLVNTRFLQGHNLIHEAHELVQNGFANLSFMVHHCPLETLHGHFPDMPAIIIGAGPSLCKNIHHLKTVKDHALLLAVDTAVGALVAQNIRPDFVVCMDHRRRNADYLLPHAEHLQETGLIMTNTVTPLIPKLFPGKRAYFVFDDSPIDTWFNALFGNTPPIGTVLSVSILALIAAARMGCRPIILIGQDLAVSHPSQDHPYPVEGVNGGQVFLDEKFLSMLHNLENVIATLHSTKVIDATEGGAKIKGTRIMDLQAAIHRYCQRPRPKPALPGNQDVAATIRSCISHLKKTRSYFQEIASLCRIAAEQSAKAITILRQIKNSPDPRVEVTDELATAVNTTRSAIRFLAGHASPSTSEIPVAYVHLLDTILAKSRLEAHRKIIEWQGLQQQAYGNTTVDGLLQEVQIHQIQVDGAAQAVAVFLDLLAVTEKRLHLELERPALQNRRASHTALLEQGDLLLRTFDLPAALECFQAALARKTDAALAHFGMGQAFLLMRQPDKALAHFRQARQRPSLAEKIDRLLAAFSEECLDAALARLTSRPHEARPYLKMILPEFPGYTRAQELLATHEATAR